MLIGLNPDFVFHLVKTSLGMGCCCGRFDKTVEEQYDKVPDTENDIMSIINNLDTGDILLFHSGSAAAEATHLTDWYFFVYVCLDVGFLIRNIL